jgi:phosphoribosylanthranilate isomerase
MVKVKICGLTREEDVRSAVESGADALGFIVGFPKSPRNLTFERAAALMRMAPIFVDCVLVLPAMVAKNSSNEIRACGADALQLYADSTGKNHGTAGMDAAALRVATGARAILVYRVRDSGDLSRLRSEARNYDAVMTDTFRPGLPGGTGETSDWSICREIRSAIDPVPMVLSGGLKPSNVARAVGEVRPFAVDASSGVESSPGHKDKDLVRTFIKNAKEAGEE